MKLLEREAATSQLRECLADADEGVARLIFLGGETGIGKTVFIRRFADSVRASTRVLHGACDALSHPAPPGPLHDAAPYLARQVQGLLQDPDRGTWLFAAVLTDLSDNRPTLFVVEDAHWADAATLDLLRYLGRRMDRTRALIVVTSRDDEVGPRHPLRNVLGDLATQPNVRKMSLSLSSESAVRELVIGTSLDPGELHQRTGGNPFFVTDVIASGAIGIPDTVRDAVLNRAARLFEPARSTLDAAAVIGYRVEPDPLTDLARVGAGPVDESLAADRWRLVKGGGAEARSRLSV